MPPYTPLSGGESSASDAEPRLPTPTPRRPLRMPPVLLPDPFSDLPHTREKRDGTDEEDGDESMSEASSVTAASAGAGRGSAELEYFSGGGAGEGGKERGLSDSSEEEGRGLLASSDRDGDEEAGYGGGKDVAAQRRRRRRRLLLLALLLLPLLLLLPPVLHSLFTSSTAVHLHRFEGKGLKKLDLEGVKNGSWWPERVELDWVEGKDDGSFSQRLEDGSITLTSLSSNSTRVLIRGEDVKDRHGERLQYASFKLSPDGEFALFETEVRKQWRHSTLSTFFLHRISPPLTLPLTGPSSAGTSFALFSPTSHTVAWVAGNDLYVLPTGVADAAFGAEQGMEEKQGKLREGTIRVTDDGGEERFNGVCDWVYEEEVFSTSLALWFSPSSTSIAFLSFDETPVPSYDYPIFNSEGSELQREEGGADDYPGFEEIRYPKAGYPNPLLTLRVFSLSSFLSAPSRPSLPSSSPSSASPGVPSALYTLHLSTPSPFPPESTIIQEVAWVSDVEVLVKYTTRDAAVERVGLFDLREGREGVVEGRTVRETDWVKRDGGWAEPTQNIHPLLPPSSPSSASSSSAPIPPTYPEGYLDVLPNPEGYRHLALFSPPSASEPVWLTGGEWEIDGGVLRVDYERGYAYILAARPSTSRHLLRVSLPRSASALSALRASGPQEPTQLTERPGKGELGAWSAASFSPRGEWYLESKEGPGVPVQRLRRVGDEDFSLTLVDNAPLAALDAEYQHASLVYSALPLPSGEVDPKTGKEGTVEVNMLEIRPPAMDESGRTKYPVLFQVYGGPSSQTINTKFQRDWHHYLSVSLGYIIIRVDVRGTGFRGRKFRTAVRGRLGELEARDVVEAARKIRARGYVDEKRVGIWGWSYGGFLTTKVIETNSSMFQLGVAVAPVTDWRYYDSVYTERYMSTPAANPGGYRNSSVHKMDGFKNAVFGLAHGTGDDNVHWQNTANLLDRFTVAGVEDYHLRIFPDSDHSISTRNAYWGGLFPWIETLLLEHFGVGGRTKQRWKLTAGERTERER